MTSILTMKSYPLISPLAFKLDEQGEMLWINAEFLEPEHELPVFRIIEGGKVTDYSLKCCLCLSGGGPEMIEFIFDQMSVGTTANISQRPFFIKLFHSLQAMFLHSEFNLMAEDWSEVPSITIAVNLGDGSYPLDHILQFAKEIAMFLVGYMSAAGESVLLSSS